LDLAYGLIKKSTQTATYGLCYYLAIESLNRAPSSFIQFKAIEILKYLQHANNELFSIIELDFDQYAQKLKGKDNNSLTNYSEKFQNLLTFVEEKYLEDLKINNDGIWKTKGKGKGKEKCLTKNTLINNILNHIANEIIS